MPQQRQLSLPTQLEQEAERWAAVQGVSLELFIIWAVAEKIGSLKEPLDDPGFPHVTYRSGAARWPTPVVRGTGVRVQTLAIAARKWGLAPSAVAENWGLSEAQVEDALAFYEAHQAQIDTAIESEAQVEAAHA